MILKATLQKAEEGGYWLVAACLTLLAVAGCERGHTSAEDEKLKKLEMRVQLLETRVEAMLDQSAKEMVRKSMENQGFTVRDLLPHQTGHDHEKISPDANEDAKPQPASDQE